MRAVTAAATLAVVCSVGVSVSAEHWPSWRGPSATGVSNESKLPERWADGQSIAWRASLGGAGVSSPVVWGDRVFVTSQAGTGDYRQGPRLGQGAEQTGGERGLARKDGDRTVRFLIEAFGRLDGRRQWVYDLAADGDLPPVHDKHNLASASPVTDGERVYAVFGTGQVVAVNAAGTLAWTRNLAKEFGRWEINWGNGSSPAIHRGALIIIAYHDRASYLLALDGRSGKSLWKTDRPSGVTSYSTPIVVPGPQGDEVVVNSSVGVEGFDATTGRQLWHFNEPNQFPIPVAMVSDGIIYLSRGYRSGPYAAIRPGGRGDIAKTHVVWRVPTGAPYVSSLVHYEGLIYMAGDVGVITCVDAKTGERVWRERLVGVYTASPLAGDGKVYLFSETGETIVVRAGRAPEVISRNRVSGRVLGTPAISQGRIFVRTDDQLVAIGS